MDGLISELSQCRICPHNCGVDRYKIDSHSFKNDDSGSGICGMDYRIKIASFGPHYGEEPELVGSTSSGTIFFSNCNLLCIFCQNYEISHFAEGRYYTEDEVAEIMLLLQDNGCNNINLVTPTHFSVQIINSIEKAKILGLNIPVVYNSSGYDKVNTLKNFEGLIDIYMPDIKFKDSAKSKLYAKAPDYFNVASEALLEMHRQVGDLIIRNGIARRGLLVRHLILPNNQSDTFEIIDFIYKKIGTSTYLNLMDQYRPCFNVFKINLINRRISREEYYNAVRYAAALGFHRPEYIYKSLMIK
jgi:putative pyruvate formate lyase activating enzyme